MNSLAGTRGRWFARGCLLPLLPHFGVPGLAQHPGLLAVPIARRTSVLLTLPPVLFQGRPRPRVRRRILSPTRRLLVRWWRDGIPSKVVVVGHA